MQVKLIRSKLIKDYPLGFTKLDGNVVSYVAVAPIWVEVNQGARPINRTTAVCIPVGMVKSCKDLNNKLLVQQVICRWDKPSQWCAQARFMS